MTMAVREIGRGFRSPLAKLSLEDRRRLDSPLSHILSFLPLDPYPWQVNVFSDLFSEPGARVLLRTPNESGKTSAIVSGAGLGAMRKWPGCQVVSTAGVWRQIEQQLWPVLRSSLAGSPDWKVVEGKITAPRVPGMPNASTWYAFSADDPEKAEGYHSRTVVNLKTREEVYCPLIFIIDEAKSVADGIFQAMYRCDPDYVLVCSTPGADSGPFFELWQPHIIRWKKHAVTWSDCDHLMVGRKKEERLALIDEKGAEDPFVQSMIFGNFFRAGEMYVFTRMDDIDHCMSGQVRHVRGERRAALDLSSGGDEQTFGCRDGNAVIGWEQWRIRDTMVLAQELDKQFKRFELKPHEIIADDGGVGGAIIDRLEELGWRGIDRYNGGAPPVDKNRYFNRVAEDTFEGLCTLVRDRKISLPHDDVLKEQMRIRRYEMPNEDSNKKRLEPKKKGRARGESSPDRLDNLEMLFSGYAHGPKNFRRPNPGAKAPRTYAGDEDFHSGGSEFSFGMRCEE